MIDFKDCTFIIPIRLDSKDRIRNLEIVLRFLQRNFDTNIIVCESDGKSNREIIEKAALFPIKYMFHEDGGSFKRTKILNDMTREAETNIIVNYDVDVVFQPYQLVNARKLIYAGITLVFPYGGLFWDLAETGFSWVKHDNLNALPYFQHGRLLHPCSVGGAFLFNKEDYRKAGWENENFISWGYEDNERLERLDKLGYNIARTGGICYHLTHHRGVDSDNTNPFFQQNQQILQKIVQMSKEDLEKHVESWKWIQKD